MVGATYFFIDWFLWGNVVIIEKASNVNVNVNEQMIFMKFILISISKIYQ